jgi:hypothetical protein
MDKTPAGSGYATRRQRLELGKERTVRTLLLAAGLCSISVSATAQTPRPDPGPLTIARQASFFVGGRDVKSDTLSTLPAYAALCHRIYTFHRSQFAGGV